MQLAQAVSATLGENVAPSLSKATAEGTSLHSATGSVRTQEWLEQVRNDQKWKRDQDVNEGRREDRPRDMINC